MKVLFIIDDLRSGGAQRQMINLARDFKSAGYSVLIYFYYPHYYYRQYLEEREIKSHCINIKNPVKRIILFRRAIRRENPMAVIAFMGVPSLIATLSSLPGKRWNLIVGERSADPKILRSFKSIIIRFFHVFANYVVANSEANIEIVRRVNPLIPKKKFRIIYNSIDLKEYIFDQDFQFVKDSILRIIILASYRELKNPYGMIEAVNMLDEESKNRLKIDWYGDKSNNKESVLEKSDSLINKYNLNKIIQFNDIHRSVNTLIQEYDAVALFSYFEGFPNAVCEGMACGKVIISSKVSDIPLFISDKSNGFLFNPNDIVSIRNALYAAIHTPPEKLQHMGRKNRMISEQLFDNKLIFSQYTSLIK